MNHNIEVNGQINKFAHKHVQHLCVRSECGKCVRAIPQGSHSVLIQALGEVLLEGALNEKLATFYPNPIQNSTVVSVFDDILVELINTV